MMSIWHVLRVVVISLFLITLLACGGKEERKAKYMEEGKLLLQEGKYEKAKLAFKNVLQIDPKDIESRYQIAETMNKLGEIKSAVGHYMVVITQEPKHLMARVRMGHIFLLIKKVADAEQMAKEALLIDPANPETLVLKASVLAAQNNNDGAIAKAKEALEKKPDDISATALIASIDAKAGKVDQAIASLKNNIEKNPDDIAPRLMLASLYMQTKAIEKVEETLAGIANAEPKVLEHRKRIAMFHLSNKNVDKAESVLRVAVNDLPEDGHAKSMLIEFLATQRTPEAAVAELLSLIELNPKDYELRFQLADLQLFLKQTDKVEQTLKEITKLDKLGPKGILARNKLARLYATLKRGDEAKALVQEIIDENPRDADALTIRGELALNENLTSEAIGDFRSVLVDQPQNINLLKLLSVAYLKSKDTLLARETMEKIIEIAPNDESARLDLVNLLLRLDNKEQAMQQIEKLLQRKPNSKAGLEALFNIQLNQKQWQQAQQSAYRLQKAYPTEAIGYYLSGMGYQREGSYDKSISSFELALAKQPETIEPLIQLIKSFLTLKQLDKAVIRLNETIQKQPKNFIAYNLLGGVYANDNKIDDAISTYYKAIKARPEWPNAYRNLASVYLTQKNKAEAIKILTAGIHETKGAIDLVNDLAMIHNRDGDYQKVIALYDAFYQQHPDSLLAANNLASYLTDYAADKADLDRAAKLAEPLEKTNNPEMLDTVAWIAFKRGDLEKAHTLLSKVLELNPDIAVSSYHLGMVYFKQGNHTNARENLEKAVNSKTDFTGLAEARETLISINESN